MKLTRSQKLKRRHLRVRKKVNGTNERPRLCVRKTLKHLYAQLVDDTTNGGCKTLATFTTATKANAGQHKSNIENATELGKTVGAELKNRGIEVVVFDRSGYRYHGCIKAIAEGVREAGVKI